MRKLILPLALVLSVPAWGVLTCPPPVWALTAPDAATPDKPVAVVLKGSMLTVTPDAASSTMVVIADAANGFTVTINGEAKAYTADQLGMLVVDASKTKAGTIQTIANTSSLFVQAIGGAGTNSFSAGTNYDYYVGGGGTNVFRAGSGFTWFEGPGKSTYIGSGGPGLWWAGKSVRVVGDASGVTVIGG